MKYKKTTLPNGVRIITVPIKGNPSVSVMVVAETGSNYESKEENGLSHFLEHMLFKGTPSRPSALTVSLELDSIGAESNAFTSNEMTAYYAKGQNKHWKKLLDVVSDMYLHANLPEAEMEKERGVILQEISMYEDLPQRHVWDVLGNLLYGDIPAGRTILGPGENIKKFTHEDFINYKNKHYVPNKTLVIVAGDVDQRALEKEVKKIFQSVKKAKKIGKDKVAEKQTAPAVALQTKQTDQTHMVMAFRAFGARDKRASAAAMLMHVLGSGMSSRLFQRLREEMGACYYVRTASDLYTDHGFLAISTGIDKNRAEEVVKALIEECKKLKETLVSPEELQKTKDFIISHMYMDLETSDHVAVFFLEEEIVRGKLEKPEEIEKRIRKVTAKDIQKAAKELFVSERLNLAVVGNISDPNPLKEVLKF